MGTRYKVLSMHCACGLHIPVDAFAATVDCMCGAHFAIRDGRVKITRLSPVPAAAGAPLSVYSEWSTRIPSMHLWLDDQRAPPDDTWTWVKTADEAIAALRTRTVERFSLDHDLGHCSACEGCKGYGSACACRCHLTGSFVANWMAAESVWPAMKPTVHSRNPVGAAYMRATIDRYGPYGKDAA